MAVRKVRPIEALVAKARQLSTGDTGALDDLLDSKRADIDAQAAKDRLLVPRGNVSLLPRFRDPHS